MNYSNASVTQNPSMGFDQENLPVRRSHGRAVAVFRDVSLPLGFSFKCHVTSETITCHAAKHGGGGAKDGVALIHLKILLLFSIVNADDQY